MAFRKLLPLAPLVMLLAGLFVAPAAEAKYKVGVGEQNPAMFDSARWQSLSLKRVRYLVHWNWNRSATDRVRGRRVHESRPHRAPAGARDVHRCSRLLRQRQVQEEAQGLPRAEREGVPLLLQGLRQAVPVGQDVLGLERGQPRLAARRTASPSWRSATTTCCASWRARASSRWSRPTCSIRRTCAPTCGRSCAAPRATRACGGCTTTRTSTTGRPRTRGGCSPPCPARCG